MRQLLLLVALCLTHINCSAIELYLSGSTATCPSSVTRYTFNTDADNSDLFGIDITNGYISSYHTPSGQNFYNQNTQSLNLTPNGKAQGYVDVTWTSSRGSVGTVTFLAQTPPPWYKPFQEYEQTTSLTVQIGSPDITGTTLFEPINSTCDHKILSFSIPVVAGANSYNWQNSFGWRLANTMVNGGYSSATFDSSISSITSGQVTVTAVNNSCPSNSSTKTFLVSRGPGPHAIEGPDDVPSGSYTKFYAPAGCTNYQWSVTGNLSIMEGQGSDQVKVYVPNPGIISVTYTDICGQNQLSDREVHSTGPAEPGVPSTQDRQSGSSTNTENKLIAESVAKELAIYPNPVANELYISSIGEDRVRIYNSKGALVNESNIAAESVRTSINTRALPNGTYHVHLFKAGKLLSEKQILIQH